MSDRVARYQLAQKELNELRESVHNTDGRISQLTEQLKSKHGCSTIGQAKKKIASLQKQQDTLTDLFEFQFEQFEEKWKDEL